MPQKQLFRREWPGQKKEKKHPCLLPLRNSPTSAVKVLPSYTGTPDYMKRPLPATHEHFSFINLQPSGHRAADLTPLYRAIPDQRDASYSHASRHQIHASYLPMLFLLSPTASWAKQHFVTPLLYGQQPWQIRCTQALTNQDSSLLPFTAVCMGLKSHCTVPSQPTRHTDTSKVKFGDVRLLHTHSISPAVRLCHISEVLKWTAP